jgi:hypothetical protein
MMCGGADVEKSRHGSAMLIIRELLLWDMERGINIPMIIPVAGYGSSICRIHSKTGSIMKQRITEKKMSWRKNGINAVAVINKSECIYGLEGERFGTRENKTRDKIPAP